MKEPNPELIPNLNPKRNQLKTLSWLQQRWSQAMAQVWNKHLAFTSFITSSGIYLYLYYVDNIVDAPILPHK